MLWQVLGTLSNIPSVCIFNAVFRWLWSQILYFMWINVFIAKESTTIYHGICVNWMKLTTSNQLTYRFVLVALLFTGWLVHSSIACFPPLLTYLHPETQLITSSWMEEVALHSWWWVHSQINSKSGNPRYI